jgi:pimeloyl-ACP methyl ester carboxylesterase
VLRHVQSPDGVPIACEVGGQGPALVLVHGAGSGRWGFDLLRPLLEASFTVMAIDRRGRGDSRDGEPP